MLLIKNFSYASTSSKTVPINVLQKHNKYIMELPDTNQSTHRGIVELDRKKSFITVSESCSMVPKLAPLVPILSEYSKTYDKVYDMHCLSDNPSNHTIETKSSSPSMVNAYLWRFLIYRQYNGIIMKQPMIRAHLMGRCKDKTNY